MNNWEKSQEEEKLNSVNGCENKDGGYGKSYFIGLGKIIYFIIDLIEFDLKFIKSGNF